MPFIPHTEPERSEMLRVASSASMDALFKHIPSGLKLRTDLDLPGALAEQELLQHGLELMKQNSGSDEMLLFVGAGAYDHVIPSAVDELSRRSEFYTAYTPYQPEISQGGLQAIYEYQTMVASLCGLDVANASLYDGSTAVYEAVLLAHRHSHRSKVLLDDAVNPRYRQVLSSYARNLGLELLSVPHRAGVSDLSGMAVRADAATAAAVVQFPNFFGRVADLTLLASSLHSSGALLIVVANPLALALLKSPGAMGADVVCGEAQPFGLPLSGGGPYLGFIATRSALVRKMPGRLAGRTVDAQGRRGFVLTLQAREQHIRREKANSNICSNQALCALRAAIFLSLLGKCGLKDMASQCLAKAAYAKAVLADLPGCSLPFDGPGFHEFVLKLPVSAERVFRRLLETGVAPGLPLGRYWGDLADCLLVCVTEKRTRKEIDRFADVMRMALETDCESDI